MGLLDHGWRETNNSNICSKVMPIYVFVELSNTREIKMVFKM